MVVLSGWNGTAAATDINGYGPNYLAPPFGDPNLNSGTVWTAGAGIPAAVDWWNWQVDDTWYYAYQVKNLSFGSANPAPIGDFRMLMPTGAAQVVTFEGDSHNNGNFGGFTKWVEVVLPQDATVVHSWVGWAAPNNGEKLLAVGQQDPRYMSSAQPYFEYTSPNAPGYVTFKVTDMDYYELMSQQFPDPSDFGTIPGPLPEPASVALLALAGLLMVPWRR